MQFSHLLNRELAEGFPNSDRAGCPGSEFLQRVAHHQVPIAEIDPWIDHLGSCSECFGEFNQLKSASSEWRQRRVILYAAAACIVVASVGILWKYLARVPGLPTPVAGIAATSPDAVTGRRGPQDPDNRGAATTPFEVTFNLSRAATRGATSSDDKQVIRVPARLLKCRMTLPFGSSDGRYYILIQRAAQSEVLKAAEGNATIIDGDIQLDVRLDLSTMAAGEYVLTYRHPGESWHHVRVVIANPTK